MAKRRREPDSDDVAAAMAELNTLFIDTSLDTHLVMLVSSSDTVADLKKKVALEHNHCFPEIGEIQVHTVKVKQRSNFYHLPDIMCVWSAFHAMKKNWFLSVDASSVHTQLVKGSLEVGTNIGVKIGITKTDEELGINSAAKIGITNADEDCRSFFSDANKNEILRLPLSCGAAEKNDVSEMIVGTSSGAKIGITNTDEDCRGLVSDANKNEILLLPLPDNAAEKNDVSEMIVVPVLEAEKPAEMLIGSHGNINSVERSMGTKSLSKKKRKLRHSKDESHNCGLEGGGFMFCPDGKDGKSAMSDSIVKVMNDQFDVEDKLVSEKASPPTTAEMTHLGSIVDSQNLRDSNRNEEVNGSKSVMDFELCQDVQADHSGVGSIMVPNSSDRPSNAGEDAKTSGSKRKKKKVRKTTAEIQDITNMAQIGNDERIKPTSETHKFDNGEEGKDLSLEQDREGIMPTNSQLQDAGKRNFRIVNSQKLLNSDEIKEDNVLESKMNNGLNQDFPTLDSGGVITSVMDASGGVGDANASGKKRKKKKVQKITVEVQDTRDVEQIGKGEMKNPCAETKFEEKQEKKGLSLEHDNEVILTPISKAPDHVDPNLAPTETSFMRDANAVADAVMDPGISSGAKKEKNKKKSGKKSVGTSIEKSGITGIPNGIRGSSGLPSPSTDHISKKTGKEESISDNEGNDDQMKLDSSNHDALEKAQDANKKEADFVTKAQTEQTLEDVSVGNQKMAEKALVSAGNCHKDFPTGETENAILETNQDDKYKENTENKSKKTTKKRKKEKHTATDVHEKLSFKGIQVGIEASATKETSIGSEQEGRHVGSSEVLPHKSEETVGKMHEIVVKNDELAENSGNGFEEINFKQYFLLGEHQYKVNSRDKNKKNPSLDRSSSGWSKTLPSNMRNQRSLSGLNGTNMMQLKTPKKKSLLDKSGAIFQDNSGESSGDENATMHSDDSTVSPSDSSSMSGVSQNSTSRGSNDSEANSQRNMTKMDLSATTMDFILRNSKRFEKAKQLASQTESQPIEFVPDTQLT